MNGKPLRWLHGEVKTPPMSEQARREIGLRCHELRVNDRNKTWRLVYRIDSDAIVILEVFEKKTSQTPVTVIRNCQRRLMLYQSSR